MSQVPFPLKNVWLHEQQVKALTDS